MGMGNNILGRHVVPLTQEQSREVEKQLLREDKSKKPDFTYFGQMFGATSRISQRFKMGEKKYARLNWRNCEDPQTYKESAVRHLFQYFDGQKDEDHLSAAVVNLMILMDLEDHEN